MPPFFFTIPQTLERAPRCLEVVMVVGKSKHHHFLSLLEASYLMDHLIQGFSSYGPDKVCPKLRHFLGHRTLYSKPGKVPGELGQLVTQVPEEQTRNGSPVCNPSSGPHQQLQLLYFHLFYILCFAYTTVSGK